MAAFSSIALAAVAVSSVASVAQGIQNARAQKKQAAAAAEANRLREAAEKKQQEIADLQAARQRRQAAREAQQRRAQIVAAGEQAGAAGSSGLAGAVGSVQTQAAVNMSFLDQTAMLSSQASSLFGEARTIANTPIYANQTWGHIAGLAGTVGVIAGSRSGSIFDSDLSGPAGMYNGGTGTNPVTGMRYGGV